MGQIVNVVERPSSRPGIVRFETNRALSGMGHDRYVAGEPIEDVRPVDELARRIFARGGISAVHINGSVITVDLEKGFTADGIADIVRGLFTFYVESPTDAPDTLAAEAAVAAAPTDAKAAEAPILDEIAAAADAGLERPADPGAEVAARNRALTAEYEAAQAAAAAEEAAATEAEPPADGAEPPAEPADEPPAEPADEAQIVTPVAENWEETAERAAEPKGEGDATDAASEGHGEVAGDTAAVPHEAEGVERASDLE